MNALKSALINIVLTLILISVVLYFKSFFSSKSYSGKAITDRSLFTRPQIPNEIPSELFKPIDSSLVHYGASDQLISEKYPSNYFDSYLKKSGTYRVVARVADQKKPIYDVIYKLNRFGVRQVEPANSKPFAKKFVAAYGCSNTFGEGLPQGEDYPSQLNKALSSNWNVYNFGFHGYGPNSIILNILNDRSYNYIIKEPSGVFVWLFIPDHLTRFFCYFDCYSGDKSWILNLPHLHETSISYSHSGRFLDSTSLWRKSLLSISKWYDVKNQGSYNYSKQDFIKFINSLNYIATKTSSKIEKKYLFLMTIRRTSILRNLSLF